MLIHRDHAGLPAAARGASVAIGNFDGVHRGHREVIRVAAEPRPGRCNRPLGVITFEPHPRELLNPAPPRPGSPPCAARPSSCAGWVSTISTRSAATGACSRPRPRISWTGGLLGELDVAAVTTGRDFRFGHRRQGDTALLRPPLVGAAAGR